MPFVLDFVYYLFHVHELRAIIRWKLRRKPLHNGDHVEKSHDLEKCFHFLELSSRSFVAVIQELRPELLVPVCIFYLILRGLDTIEDDMTIDIYEKEPLLREFHTHIEDEDWAYGGNGPDEKDRELLVKFDCVTREFNKIKEGYRIIIKDITRQMGNGMADYAKNAEGNIVGVKTIKDYELYCHYVAGLVGQGVTQLIVKAKLADPALLQGPKRIESMGQFLQQTNIIRDIREDHEGKRCFWPKEVWSKYVDQFNDLFLPPNREKALQCSSEMVLMALSRANDCLSYMEGVEDPSFFNFVAIPQSMAIATLELCFQNPAIFDRNVKITKGVACHILDESTQGFQHVCNIFGRYAKKIRAKNNSSDPYFHEVRAACVKIESFVERGFVHQTLPTLSDGADHILAVGSEAKRTVKTQESEAKQDLFTDVLAAFTIFGIIVVVLVK